MDDATLKEYIERRCFGTEALIRISIQGDGQYVVEDLRSDRQVYCDTAKGVAKKVRKMLEG